MPAPELVPGMISDFARYPNQPGTSLNVGNINYATLRMQAALQRLQNMEEYQPNQ